jgi:hypothetical protein
MNRFLVNKNFKSGFVLGIVLFLLMQAISFILHFFSTAVEIAETPFDISRQWFWDIGFPFSTYYGMYGLEGKINFTGLVGNIMFGVVLSVGIGLTFKFFRKDL